MLLCVIWETANIHELASFSELIPVRNSILNFKKNFFLSVDVISDSYREAHNMPA